MKKNYRVRFFSSVGVWIAMLGFGFPAAAQWYPAGLPNDQASDLLFWNNKLIALTNEGFQISLNGGASWMASSSEESLYGTPVIDSPNIYLVSTSYESNISFSLDDGQSWFQEPTDTIGYQMGPLHMYVLSQDTLALVARSGIFLSTDQGLLWHRASLPSNTNSFSIINVLLRNDSLFVITDTAGYLSIDFANTWELTDSITLQFPIKASPLGYYSFGSLRFAIFSNGELMRSPDNGKTWVTLWMPNSGAIDQLLKYQQYLFAATTSGVYLSSDEGDDWTSIGYGIPPQVSISSLVIVGNELYAGGSSYNVSPAQNAVWKRSLSDFEINSEVSENSKSLSISVSPNPTTGLVTLTGVAGIVTVENMLGEAVTTTQPPPIPLRSIGGGVTIDLTNEPAGIYFVRVETASGPVVQKIVKE